MTLATPPADRLCGSLRRAGCTLPSTSRSAVVLAGRLKGQSVLEVLAAECLPGPVIAGPLAAGFGRKGECLVARVRGRARLPAKPLDLTSECEYVGRHRDYLRSGGRPGGDERPQSLARGRQVKARGFSVGPRRCHDRQVVLEGGKPGVPVIGRPADYLGDGQVRCICGHAWSALCRRTSSCSAQASRMSDDVSPRAASGSCGCSRTMTSKAFDRLRGRGPRLVGPIQVEQQGAEMEAAAGTPPALCWVVAQLDASAANRSADSVKSF